MYSATGNTEKQKALPWSAYIQKILEFHRAHYCVGELYMEYLKGSCDDGDDVCSFCAKCQWIGPVMTRIPQPMPDNDQLPALHYLSVFDTPLVNDDGSLRKPDDYHPRAQIKIAYHAGLLKLDSEVAIQDFSKKLQYSMWKNI